MEWGKWLSEPDGGNARGGVDNLSRGKGAFAVWHRIYLMSGGCAFRGRKRVEGRTGLFVEGDSHALLGFGIFGGRDYFGAAGFWDHRQHELDDRAGFVLGVPGAVPRVAYCGRDGTAAAALKPRGILAASRMGDGDPPPECVCGGCVIEVWLCTAADVFFGGP